MKKAVTFIQLFIFSNFFSQFNTVAYNGKLKSISVNAFTENHFSNQFLSYHIEGKIKRKKNEKISPKSNDSLSTSTVNKISEKSSLDKNENIDTEEDLPIKDEDVGQTKQFKKLQPIIPDVYDNKDKQLIFMPLTSMKITSDFGRRYHPVDKVQKFHTGVDLRANNDYVFAVLNGVVSDVGYSKGAGNYIKVQHGEFETIYLHLSKTFFSFGDIIYSGDILALSGNTGKSTGPHLHFAVKENGKYISPVQFLNDLIITNNTLSDYNNYGKY